MSNPSGSLPPVPKYIEVDGQQYPIYVPFYYASLTSFWIHYAVPPGTAAPLLEGTSLRAGVFDGHELVNLDFQTYTTQAGNGMATTVELELNVVAYPDALAGYVPELSVAQFLAGEDQTKTYGHFRLHVPCDSAFAVAAGKTLYGEYKFVASFEYDNPDPNNPDVHTWSYSCQDDAKDAILAVKADLRGATAVPANPSELIDYSMLEGRLVGSRRTLWGTVRSYHPLPEDVRQAITLELGPSGTPMRSDLERLLGENDGYAATPPVAAQVFRSHPAVAESRAYYPPER